LLTGQGGAIDDHRLINTIFSIFINRFSFVGTCPAVGLLSAGAAAPARGTPKLFRLEVVRGLKSEREEKR
jgi:hypothetical protein